MYIGFNPCFSGCWSATTVMTPKNEGNCEVSILVLVDVGLRPHLNSTHNYNNYVSILVLVDVGLRPGCPASYQTLEGCFNPCFSGCWSATGVTGTVGASPLVFQSLF